MGRARRFGRDRGPSHPPIRVGGSGGIRRRAGRTWIRSSSCRPSDAPPPGRAQPEKRQPRPSRRGFVTNRRGLERVRGTPERGARWYRKAEAGRSCGNISGPMAGIDLHAHTNYSDGTFTPREAVSMARERRLEVLAVTDHDTTSGLAEAVEAGAELGVDIVPGVEFSTVYGGEGVHILCYHMDPEHPQFRAELQ